LKIRRISAGVAVLAVGALALSACSNTPSDEGSPSGSSGQGGTGGAGAATITVAEVNQFTSLNATTATGNLDLNAKIALATGAHLYYVTSDLTVEHDNSLGTVEKLSDDPLTVKYTINEGQQWSDGEPIDANDLVLAWAVYSGYYDDASYGDDGSVTGGNAYFSYAGSTQGINDTEFPEIGDDGRSITLTYAQPFADWEVVLDLDRPAHIVAKKAGLADAAALTDLLRSQPRGDAANPQPENPQLRAVADFYNTGWDTTTMPSDPDLLVSSGPYQVSDIVEGQSVTLTPNENYTGTNKAKLDSIIVRTIGDPSAQIQALQNGEVDVISPQANADTLSSLEGLSGVTVHQGAQLAYDHIDLNFSGVFADPNVREAFMKTVPRQAILDSIITPLDPEAQVLNSQVFLPQQDGYEEAVATNGSSAFGEPDIEGAKALLNGQTPTVRILYSSENTNRVDAFTLIQQSASEAGFQIVDEGDATWNTRLGDGSYDAAIFGWTSSGVSVSDTPQVFGSGQASNFNGFANPEADALMNQLIQTVDPDEQIALRQQIDKLIWDSFYGLPLFATVGVDAVAERVTGIDAYNPNQYGVWWNVWEWGVNDA